MFPERSKAALSRFFIEQGPRWCHSVRTVVHRRFPFLPRQPIQLYLPGSRHVLDRFHAVRWFAQGLTLVRRELQRRQPPGVKPAYEPDLFRARFCLPEKKRPSHPPGPTTSPAAVRCSSPSQGGLGRPTRALRPVRGQRSPRRPRSPRPFRGPLQQRTDTRVPRHRGHHPQLDRRDPRLAPRSPFQRTPRRDQ